MPCRWKVEMVQQPKEQPARERDADHDASAIMPILPPQWTITAVDPIQGEPITAIEAAFRQRIRGEAEHGEIAVDTLYWTHQQAIHRPLIAEEGKVAGDSWRLERANRTTLVVPIGEVADPQALKMAAVTIAKAAIDEFAGEVMLQLFATANDPPYWRRPTFSVRLSDLMDRLGFTRDARGVHYTLNRRKVSSTLLALHLTHVGLRHDSGPGGGRALGFLAPLLSAVGYATKEDVRHLSLLEVFEQGLPEEIAISIHPLWFAGVRGENDEPGTEYILIPRPVRERSGRSPRGRRSPVLDLLREYLERCVHTLEGQPLVITRERLLDVAQVSDNKPHQANRTLQRALSRLKDEGAILSCNPEPLPSGQADIVIICLNPELAGGG